MIDFDADLAMAMADPNCGEPITVAGVRGHGTIDRIGELTLPDGGAPVVGARWHVVVRDGAFPGLKEKAPVSARGASWTARNVLPIADGREVEFYLLGV